MRRTAPPADVADLREDILPFGAGEVAPRPTCPRCGSQTRTKIFRSRFGYFRSCSRYPHCRGVVPVR